eukprot:CAMPEP_0169447734 /NCGR_PEP_ID=MMETSP1042-20121227/11672_1 /TAXON_ID=464988 /ORGANISM="Hemiselmis andersenii, Strain CCMP1180" /LENGTH=465 /DNA_ID=CAMNT_0009559299 /DNA_START=498 /DNA_END=1895 /DNA_ORIENTATION=+
MIGDSPSLQALPQRSPWDLNGLPTWSPAPRHGPGSGVWRAAKDAGFALGACPNGTVLDIGVNDGSDLDFFVQRGYCVLGVEANVALANKLQKRYRHIPSQVAVLNVGLDEVPGEMTFWMTRSLVHSSFERQKALTHDKMAKPQNVTVVRCEDLWSLIQGHRLVYLRVDIEERHFLCVEGLARIPRRLLPPYMSWEMHEFARSAPFPVLDAFLLTVGQRLGYGEAKVVSNLMQAGKGAGVAGGRSSGGQMPDELRDVFTNNERWRTVPDVLKRGLGEPRKGMPGGHKGDWWDFHVRLGGGKGTADTGREAQGASWKQKKQEPARAKDAGLKREGEEPGNTWGQRKETKLQSGARAVNWGQRQKAPRQQQQDRATDPAGEKGRGSKAAKVEGGEKWNQQQQDRKGVRGGAREARVPASSSGGKSTHASGTRPGAGASGRAREHAGNPVVQEAMERKHRGREAPGRGG